jgi:hypothetical protein
MQNGQQTNAEILWGLISDPIVVAIAPNGQTIRNTTLPGHIFHAGTVTRNIFQGANGALFVKTTGTGTEASRFKQGLDQLGGPLVFASLNSRLRNFIEEGGTCE